MYVCVYVCVCACVYDVIPDTPRVKSTLVLHYSIQGVRRMPVTDTHTFLKKKRFHIFIWNHWRVNHLWVTYYSLIVMRLPFPVDIFVM